MITGLFITWISVGMMVGFASFMWYIDEDPDITVPQLVAATVFWPMVALGCVVVGVKQWGSLGFTGNKSAPNLSRKQRREIAYKRELAAAEREMAEAHREYERVLGQIPLA